MMQNDESDTSHVERSPIDAPPTLVDRLFDDTVHLIQALVRAARDERVQPIAIDMPGTELARVAFEEGREQGRRETAEARPLAVELREQRGRVYVTQITSELKAAKARIAELEQSLAHAREQGHREAADAIAAMLDNDGLHPIAKDVRDGKWRPLIEDA